MSNDVREIRTRLSLDGEAAFKNSLKSVDSSLRAMRSELKSVSTNFGDSTEAMYGYQRQSEILAKMNEQLKVKYKALSDAVDTTSKEYEEAKQKAEALTEAKGADAKETQAAWQNVEVLGNKMDAFKTRLNDTKTKLHDNDRQLKLVRESMDNLSASKADDKIKGTGDAAKEAAGDGLQKLQSEGEEAGDSLKSIGTKSLDASERIEHIGDIAKTTAENGLTTLKVVLANLASDAIRALASALGDATGKLKDFAEEAIEVGMTYEESMAKVKALSGATDAEMQQLDDAAKALGRSTVYAASDVADAFGYMSLAGWDTQEMLDGICGVLDLGVASQMDLAQASDMVTDYLTAFGLSASDASHFVDLLAYTQANSNTTTSALGEAYKNCASTARSMGYSVEEVTAVLGTMANAGVKGGEAGTALSSIMTRLATDTKGCATDLAAYGVAVYDEQGNMQSLTSILQGCADVYATLTDEQQANLAKTIAGTSQYAAFQTILSGLLDTTDGNVSSFAAMKAGMEACDGAAAQMAQTMGDTLSGSKKSLDSKLESIQLKLYEVLTPVIQTYLPRIEACLDWMYAHVDALVPLVDGLASGAEQVLDRVLAPAAEKMLPMLSDSIQWICAHVAGIAPLVGDVASAAQSIFDTVIKPAISTLFPPIQALVQWIFDHVSELHPVVASIKDLAGEILQDMIQPIADTFLPLIQDAMTVVFAHAEDMAQGIDAIKGTISGIYQNILRPMLQAVLPPIQKAVTWIVENMDQLLPIIEGVAAGVETAFAIQKITAFGSAAQETVQSIKTSLMALQTSNPLGWLTLGVTAAVGLGTALYASLEAWDETEKAAREASKQIGRTVSDETQSILDGIDACKTSWEQVKTSRAAAFEKIDTSGAGYEDLLTQLRTVVDESGNVKKGYEDTAQVIISQLSEATGMELGLQDGMITKNGEVCESWRQVQEEIEQTLHMQQAQSLLDASQDTYQAAQQNVIDLTGQIAQLEKEIQQKESQISGFYTQLDAVMKEASQKGALLWNEDGTFDIVDKELRRAYEQITDRITGANEVIGTMKTSVSDLEAQYRDSTTEIANYSDLQKAVITKDYDSIDAAATKLQYGFRTSATATKQELEAQVASYTQQINYMLDANKKRAGTYSEAQLQSLQELRTLAQAELDAANGDYLATVKSGNSDMVSAISAYKKDYEKAGKENAKAVNTGMESQKADGISKTEDTQSALLRTISARKDSYFSAGTENADAHTTGLDSQRQNAINTMSGIVGDVLWAASSGMQGMYDTGSSSGYYFGIGLRDGVDSTIGLVIDEVSYLTGTLLSTVCGNLGIHSPSRVAAEIGAYWDEGLANGIRDSIRLVAAASEEVAQRVITSTDFGDPTVPVQYVEQGVSAASDLSQGSENHFGGIRIQINHPSMGSDQDIEQTALQLSDQLVAQISKKLETQRKRYATAVGR